VRTVVALVVEISVGFISPLSSRTGESLNDNEIVQNVRHNLVFSLARHVVDRCYRARVAGKPPRAVLEETAGLLDAALRVL